MRQISALRLIGVGIITAMLLLFQNCGPAKVSSDTLSSNADSNTDLGSSGPGVTPTPGATPPSTPSSSAALSIFSSNIDFGSVSIFSSSTQGALLTNSGNVTLTISMSVISNVFQIINAPDKTTCGSTLPVGESCIIAMRFTPEAQGSVTGMLRITTNAPNSPHLIQLTGRGTF